MALENCQPKNGNQKWHAPQLVNIGLPARQAFQGEGELEIQQHESAKGTLIVLACLSSHATKSPSPSLLNAFHAGLMLVKCCFQCILVTLFNSREQKLMLTETVFKS